MTALMSTFESVKIQDYTYLIFFVFWSNLENKFTEQLRKQGISFGEEIGGQAFVILSHGKASFDTAEEVRKKKWPEEAQERLQAETSPFVLIIDKDFDEFTPKEHHWVIIWFSDYEGNPREVHGVLQQLLRKIKAGSNLFVDLQEKRGKKWYRKWAKYVEVKPKVFGVSLNAKGIMEEALGL